MRWPAVRSTVGAAAHAWPRLVRVITGAVPSPAEIRNCRGYLERELDLLTNLRVVVALGRLAFDVYLSILRDRGSIPSRSAFRFAHNAAHRTGEGMPVLVSSYHPSQQNTSTGKLTEKMLLDVFLGVLKKHGEQ